MRRAMLDTEEEDGYFIALWPLSSSKQRANASIVPMQCLLTSSALLPAPAPDASLYPMPDNALITALRGTDLYQQTFLLL